MTIIDLAKELLEFYSEPKTITFPYSKKTVFKMSEGRNFYGYSIVFYGKTEIGGFSFVKNEKIIKELNAKILDENFNATISLSTNSLSKTSIELIKILISKLEHLDRDLEYGYIDEKEKSKLIKNNDFNTIFFRYLARHLEEIISTRISAEITFSNHKISQDEATLITYALVLHNKLNTNPIEYYPFKDIKYLTNKKTNFPLFLIDEKPDEIQQILKDVCPILLKIGDIENFLKLFAFSDFNVNDTLTIVPVITWCIENHRDDLIQQPLDILKRIQPYHSQILEAEKFLEKQQLIRKSDISLTDINQLSGIDFESLVIEKLKNYNHIAKIERTPTTKDFGADIILVTNNETKIAIQCKRFSSKVNLKAVQEITAALKHYNADIGIVISNNGFLPSAIQLAASNNIELWGSEELLKLITQQSNFSVLFEC